MKTTTIKFYLNCEATSLRQLSEDVEQLHDPLRLRYP